MKKVSIIVVLYNSDLNKITATLNSILLQEKIEYEVLISDDGSEEDYFAEITKLIDGYNFKDYRLIKNEKNVGTVKNIIGALEKSVGEYVFITSPGDLLYNSTTMYDFYNFAQNNNAKIVFGNAVHYNKTNDKVNVLNQFTALSYHEFFNATNSVNEMYSLFLFKNYIVGATYFRERECAIKYIKQIQSNCRYVEDTTSSMLALADGVKILHYNRNIVWYEAGTGISTSGNNKWQKIIESEVENILLFLQKEYPDDTVLDSAIKIYNEKSKFKKILILLFNHPTVSLLFIRLKLKVKFGKKLKINYDINIINELLHIKENIDAGN